MLFKCINREKIHLTSFCMLDQANYILKRDEQGGYCYRITSSFCPTIALHATSAPQNHG